MGPRVLRVAVLCVSAVVTVAIFALAPIYTPTVLAAAHDAFDPPHQCGGG